MLKRKKHYSYKKKSVYAELPSSASDAVLCSVLVRKMWVDPDKNASFKT